MLILSLSSYFCINQFEIINRKIINTLHMFKNHSFSVDSGPNQNNSLNFNSPNKILNTSDEVKNNDDQYDFNANIANYNFREFNQPTRLSDSIQPYNMYVKENDNIKRESEVEKLKIDTFRRQSDPKIVENKINLIQDKKSSLLDQNYKPKGLLKQKMKVDYAFDHKQTQSELHPPKYPKVSHRPGHSSQIVKNDFISANLFSCMDAPDYQRDFQVSPKVISRKHY